LRGTSNLPENQQTESSPFFCVRSPRKTPITLSRVKTSHWLAVSSSPKTRHFVSIFQSKDNRVYTGLGEDEMYFVLRGKDFACVADSLTIITSANAALNDYAKGRRSQLATI
jgi:hypothetical protein